jgi:3-O-methylgallate 3,4-dioxygenase
MAQIVSGIAAAHSPQLNTKPEDWYLIVRRDEIHPHLDMPALRAQARPGIEAELTMDVWQRKYDACQVAIERLCEIHRESKPDVALIIGNDQDEMFKFDNMPAMAVYWGDTVLDIPRPIETLHESQVPGEWAYHGTEVEAYPTHSGLGLHLVKSLIRDQFDVAQMNEQPAGRSIGHSYTFFRHRVFKDDAVIPMVPVMFNSFFEPNNPTPARSYAFGQALRRAVDSFDSDLRVGVYVSGGLSHFLVDEELDWAVIDSMRDKDVERLLSIPEEKLVSGSAEIRNWMVGAGFFENEPLELIDYQACYRTDAMTGCGMAFAEWKV